MQNAVTIKTGSRFVAEQSGSALIIRLAPGCLESRLSVRDRRQIQELLGKYAQVVLDFADVGDTKGSGLYNVADWVDVVQSAQHALVLARCAGPVSSLLGVLKICRGVPVVSTLPEAFAAFDKKALAHVSG